MYILSGYAGKNRQIAIEKTTKKTVTIRTGTAEADIKKIWSNEALEFNLQNLQI